MSEIKKCPFSGKDCSEECALYILPEEFNETVKNKLDSIGVIDKTRGVCSLKNLSLGFSRFVFENSSNYKKNNY